MGEVIQSFEVPYPPSINHYWRRVGNKTLISREGRAFRERCASMVRSLGLTRLSGLIFMRVLISPPDHRRRDIDNVLKALLDALEHAGVYEDDSQISELTIKRLAPSPPDGEAFVELRKSL